jgi:hypothetical protein
MIPWGWIMKHQGHAIGSTGSLQRKYSWLHIPIIVTRMVAMAHWSTPAVIIIDMNVFRMMSQGLATEVVTKRGVPITKRFEWS